MIPAAAEIKAFFPPASSANKGIFFFYMWCHDENDGYI
jgi:hypothetical protein